MDRTVHRIVPTIVTITPVMLCLVYVNMVVEMVGWAHPVNNVSLLGLSYKKISILYTT
jgi:hypothetical protein